MKRIPLYIASLALAAGAFSACDNEFERPPMILPTSGWTANTTIEDFKAAYWSTVESSPRTVGLTADGDSIIVKGRVCSSDASGNIFKYLFIQGESEALALSLDFYDIYQSYKFGQEVYVNLTGLTIGGYSGLMCVGSGTDANGRVARAPEATFKPHAEANGLPNAALVDTFVTTIADVNAAKSTAEGLQTWQSRLVRFDDVRFENAGQPFAVGTSSNSRYIVDAAGNRMNVYNSTYADFKDDLLPYGNGSVVGILSYFGTNWQVLLIDAEGCIDFDGTMPPAPEIPDGGDGSEAKPYTVEQIIALNPTSTQDAVASGVWAQGYIVGYIPTGGSTTTLSMTVFGADDNAAASNLVIAPSKEEKDYNKCIAVQLVSGSEIRSALNLMDHPENIGKQLDIKGDVMKYCGGPGIKSPTAYKLDGVEGGGQTTPAEGAQFKAVNEITSGKSYILVAEGKMGISFGTKNYGYISVIDATVTDGIISADKANSFTFTAVEGGYTIQAADERYVYMTGTYNSFNLDAKLPAKGGVWKVTFDGGKASITNVEMNKTIQFDPQYNSFGSYSDSRGVLPTLYELVD